MGDLDWRSLGLREGTPLHHYLALADRQYEPMAWHWWCGLAAIGLIVGRNACLPDQRTVYGNLQVALVGGTGSGKDMAASFLREVLPDSVDRIPRPKSSVALLDCFAWDATSVVPDAKTAPVRGFLHYSELSDLVKQAAKGRSGGGLSGDDLPETLMHFFDGFREVSSHSRGSGKTVARDPFLSIVAGAQPERLRLLLSNDDTVSGWANRWVFAIGETTKIRPAMGAATDYSHVRSSLQVLARWADTPREISFTHDGLEAFSDFYARTIFGDRQAVMLGNRLDLLAKKVLLLLAVNDRADQIGTEHVDTLIKLYPRIVASYAAVGAAAGASELEQVCEWIVEKMRARRSQHGWTANEIRSQLLRHRKVDRALLSRALDTLVTFGDLVLDRGAPSAGGRPREVRYALASD